MELTHFSSRVLLGCFVVMALCGCKSDVDPVVPTNAAGGAVGAGGAESVRLTAVPADALDDEPVAVTVSGLEPGAWVSVRAETDDATGKRFAAEANYQADASGQVEVATADAWNGSYQGVDGMGLFTSMLRTNVAEPNAVPFNDVPLRTREVTLTATVEGTAVASAVVVRRSVLDDTQVTRSVVAEQGLVGAFFAPTAPGPHPTLLVLGGSEGGMPESRAALLASHGYAALALAYFGQAGLPAQLASIPLEYFEKAVTWLEEQPSVDRSRLGVMGSSKGGELALLLASRCPTRFGAVVAYVPSSVVWQGIPKGAAAVGSSWSYQGVDLPYVPMTFTAEEIGHFMRQEPQQLTPAYVRALQDQDAADAAAIPVENIAGPVLLISAADDGIWPSRKMAEALMARLDEAHHAYADVHLTYDGAGHLISHPYLPTTMLQYALNAFGGSPAATATACAESWLAVTDFLSTNLE